MVRCLREKATFAHNGCSRPARAAAEALWRAGGCRGARCMTHGDRAPWLQQDHLARLRARGNITIVPSFTAFSPATIRKRPHHAAFFHGILQANSR
jgi:hypothetical protein